MLRTVLRRRAAGESVEHRQPDLITPSSRRKGRCPCAAGALAEHKE